MPRKHHYGVKKHLKKHELAFNQQSSGDTVSLSQHKNSHILLKDSEMPFYIVIYILPWHFGASIGKFYHIDHFGCVPGATEK